MAAEFLITLARVSVVASLAIVLALMLRSPARRFFGGHRAYAVWLTVPLAVTGSLIPIPLPTGPIGPLEMAHQRAMAWLSSHGHARNLLALWLVGFAASAAVVAWKQARFLAAAKAGRAGPAAVGVLHARFIAPADAAQRFTPEEWRLVRAHERAHINRLDARYNAFAVLAQCIGWFNPLAHLAVHAMRLDQEIACDATVMDRLPSARRLYAETLLRTQLGSTDTPLVCQWGASARRPLEARLEALVAGPPTQRRHDIGLAVVAVLCVTAFGAAWTTQPARRPTEVTAPSHQGVCWRMFRAAGAAPRYAPIASDAENMESCAARLEAVRLVGAPTVEGAYQGFFIFVDKREILSSRYLDEPRYPLFAPRARAEIDAVIEQLIRKRKSDEDARIGITTVGMAGQTQGCGGCE